tara:strand:+ start:430 stop:1710 length:1281 start_codon:yes stop_codon:yes gene_type:complete
MNMKIFFSSLVFFSLVFSQNNQSIDGVAAIVEEHLVLKSDLAQMLNMSIIQNKIDPIKDIEKIKTLEKSILESMIDQKIILKRAELDSVIVEENEVNLALDQQVQMLISQAGGEKKAEEALGQSIKSFRREFWYEMRDRLLSEKYQQQLINNIKVTRLDVLNFYETYRDSLPTIPLKAKIRHCLIKVKPSETSKKSSLLFLKNLKVKIEQGESFSDLAEIHSEDPGSKNNAGDLGWVKRGSLVKSFETVAFTSPINKVTDPVESEFGFHLIETLEKAGDKIRVRHILNIPKKTEEDNVIFFNFATTLKNDSIKSLSDFVFYTKKYSDDEITKKVGGSLGWVDPNNYSIPEIGLALKYVKKNECSPPINSDLGYHLIWVEDFKKGGKPNLEDHWFDIENMSLNKKKMDWYQNWLKKSRENIFIERIG